MQFLEEYVQRHQDGAAAPLLVSAGFAIGQTDCEAGGGCEDQREEEQQQAYQNRTEDAGGHDPDAQQYHCKQCSAQNGYQERIQGCT